MSYEKFYGLKEMPFAITPNAKYFFENDQHTAALIKIKHAIDSRRGLSVVIGEMGLGKTFLSRKMLDKLQSDTSKYEASLLIVIHHEITIEWLLAAIAAHIGVESPADNKTVVISQISRRLQAIHEAGKICVVLIDEAHMLRTREIYEELRGLLNIEAQSSKLLNLVLFGPPVLAEHLKLDPSLISRISMRMHLDPLEEKNTWGYIQYRLEVAGAHEEIFPRESCTEVWEYTGGVPRLINSVCDNCLLEGYLAKKILITPSIVEKVAKNLGVKKIAPKQKIRGWYPT